MAHAGTYAAVTAVSIAGAVAGVHLGRDAISEINPIYYQTSPSTRFFSDLSPNAPGSVTWSNEVPTDYWANDVTVSGGSSCPECSTKFTGDRLGEVGPEIAPTAADLAYGDGERAEAASDGRVPRANSPATGEEALSGEDTVSEEPAIPFEDSNEQTAPVAM
jgi:hypothetical protein